MRPARFALDELPRGSAKRAAPLWVSQQSEQSVRQHLGAGRVEQLPADPGLDDLAHAGQLRRDHRAAAARLTEAIRLADALDLRLLIFDAFRPSEAQWVLWNHTPDPEFLSDPRRGSPHSRGVALDLTLADRAGNALDMGTEFDAFTPLSHHATTEIPEAAQRNRLLLLGLMTAAGWDLYTNEWWHYQLPDAAQYPLLSDDDLPVPMMTR